MKRVICILLLVLGGCDRAPTEPPLPPLTPVEYLREHAVVIRSIDPADENFADLQPLKQMIGDARIVALGEATHGDGATFLVKARLVRFLHREMGFDVIALESGFYDVQKAWSWALAGEPLAQSVQRGIFTAWSASAQAAPLFEYLAAAAQTSRPMELVGFDLQMSAMSGVPRAAAYLPDDLLAVLQRRGSPAGEDPRFELFASSIPRMYGDASWLYNKPTEEEKSAFLASIDFLRAELVRLGGQPGPGELGYWLQVMESVEQNARGQWMWTGQPGEPAVQYWNQRDRQMARNLIWHATHGFPGRRIVIWAATSHIQDNLARQYNRPREEFMAMGDHLRDAFGDAFYSVGFVSNDGTWGYPLPGQPLNPLQPMPAESLEGRFVEAGMEVAMVDLRNPAPGGEWLRRPFVSRPLGHVSRGYAWGESLDALLFIRTMTPSTPWTPAN
jgi:erythromycin esterase